MYKQENDIYTLTGHLGAIDSLIKINDSQIASGSTDSTIKIWDIPTGSCLYTLEGH